MRSPTQSISGKVVKNAASQMGGRLALTTLRFAIVVIITNQAGAAVFGEYTLLMSFLLFAEVLIDFGMTDALVRTLSQEPARQSVLLGALFRAKVFLALAAVVCLLGGLLALGYPRTIFTGGLVAVPALLSYAGVLVFRAVLKTQLKMQREVAAEVIGVMSVIPLYWFFAQPGTSVAVLIACYSMSRMLFFLVLFLGSRPQLGAIDFRGGAGQARWLASLSYPLGISVLLVCVYDALDPVLLSKFHNAQEIAWFSGPSRFMALLTMMVYPVADSALPLLGAQWRESKLRFRETVDTTFRLVTFLAAGGFCVFFVSAEFLLSLMGPEMSPAVGVFRVLAFVAVARSLMSVATPVVIAAGGVKHVLWITTLGVSVKLAALFWLVPSQAAAGAALANVGGEVFSIVVSSFVVRHLVGFGFPWLILLRVVPVCAVAVGLARLTGLSGSWAGGLLTGLVYLALGLAIGVVPMSKVQELVALVRRRLSRFNGVPAA